MMMMTEAPADLFDVFAVGPGTTLDGELLGRLNDAPAGAWQAVMLESIDVEALTAEDLLEFLRATGRMIAWVAAMQVRAVARLTRLRGPASAAVELGCALREPLGAAQRRVHYASTLVRRLPATLAAMARGALSAAHADKLVDAVSGVQDPDVVAEVERRSLASAAGKTAKELGRYARDLVKTLDPAGVQKRNREARDTADVTFYPDDDGMSDVIVHAPVEDGVVIKTAADADAATAKAAGDPRPVGVLRAETIAGWAADYLSGRCACVGSAAPRSGGRPIEIGITVGLRTALGVDTLPGEVPGQGIVPREVIARMIAAEHAKLRLLVIDETTGRLLYRATESYRPTAEQVAQVRATYLHSVGPGSGVLAGRCDTDHVTAYPDGATVIGNLIPLDRTWHRAKTLHGVHVTLADDGTVTITTPLGQTRTVQPYDYRMSNPTSPGEHGRTTSDTSQAGAVTAVKDDEHPPF
jgi:Domain of unknown function (DUF222)